MLDSLRMRRTASEVVNLDLTCNATFPSPVHVSSNPEDRFREDESLRTEGVGPILQQLCDP